MISLPMEQDAYAKVISLLKTQSDITVTEHDGNSGFIKTSQIEGNYVWQPNVLDITLTAKHGIAKFASEDTIKSHLQDMLKNLN